MAAALSLRWSGYFTFKCIRQYTFINNEVTQNKHLFSASFIKRVVRQFSKLPSLCGVAPLPLEMPSLSPTMTQGRIVKWLKKEGEDVAVGDALCEIETDKAVVVMESSEDGVLAKILVQEDSPQVNLGTLIALMVGEGEDWRKLDVSLLKATAAAEAQTPTQTLPPPAATQQWRLSPAARHILDTHGLGAHLAKATGPRGVITKEDALNLINQHSKVTSHPASAATAPAPVDLSPPSVQSPASPPPPSPPRKPAAVASFTEIPASSVRKVIAERLTHSKSSIPHVYASVDCDLESVMKLRKQLAEENIKVSVNDFIIKVAAVTLKEIPTVNIVLSPEGPRPLDSIHISIAVATPRGLITPIIRDAASKGLVEIAATAKALSQKARDGKLLPEEYQGGSFSISNLGMFGIREFSAVINPPQACILAVGNARSELKLDQQNSEEPRVHINKQITVTLSSDGRLVDEELASQFLKQFRCNLEQPQRLALV